MRSHRRGFGVRRAIYAGIVVAGLLAVAGAAWLYGEGTQGAGGQAGNGTSAVHDTASRGKATGGPGLTGELTPSGPTDTTGAGRTAGSTGGQDAFAMSGDIAESFSSLTKQQQARILRRCKDVIARPGEADPNQLAICQRLAATTRR